MSCPNHRRPWKQAKMLVATHLNGQRVILAGRRQVNRRRKGLACDAARCGCVGACSGRRKSARQSGPQDLLALHRRHPTRRRRRRRVIANHLKFLKNWNWLIWAQVRPAGHCPARNTLHPYGPRQVFWPAGFKLN